MRSYRVSAVQVAPPMLDMRWSVEDRLADIRRRAALGKIRPEAWHASHRHLALDRVLAVLAELPPIDRLVVCHGDTCAPNTLIGDDGGCAEHVDLGALGVADRWADFAIATWSTQWNYAGPRAGTARAPRGHRASRAAP